MPADLRERQVGESYRDYAARMRGDCRAAELDRDRLAEELKQAQARIAELEAEA